MTYLEFKRLASNIEYIEGPWCWVLSDIEPLHIPFRAGQQGLYDVDLDRAIADGPKVAAAVATKEAEYAERKAKRAAKRDGTAATGCVTGGLCGLEATTSRGTEQGQAPAVGK